MQEKWNGPRGERTVCDDALSPQPVRLVSDVTLAALPNAVGLSRAMASRTLDMWGLGHLIEDAELVVSELVTNAVKATGLVDVKPTWGALDGLATIQVKIGYQVRTVVIEVWDRDPTPPAPQDAAPEAEGGRGLLIVDALCERWDHYQSIEGGKVVWAELLIPPLPVTDSGLPRRIRRERGHGDPLPADRDRALLLRVLNGLDGLD